MAHDDQTGWYTDPAQTEASAVSSLALRVVSVLNERQARQQFAARPYISNILDRRITCRANFDAADVVNELRCFQISDDVIIDSYIPVAARSIGEKWVSDELGFAEVTIASARLQALLTEIAYCDTASAALMLDPPRLLVVICEGDQHSLGGFVVAAQLRRRGAVVEVICSEDSETVARQIQDGDHHAVLFSCSRRAGLASIAQVVTTARRQSAVPPLFVLGGIVLDYCKDIKGDTGVDLVTNDLDAVIAMCEQESGVSPGVEMK
jgi:methylmalonyl-CoA mutase cobalamin-binding subunit